MARNKKSLEPVIPVKPTIKEQVEWLKAHAQNDLFVETPARTSMLDIFTMLEDVRLDFRAGDDRLESCAGAYKLFLSETNPALFNNLAANAASIL